MSVLEENEFIFDKELLSLDKTEINWKFDSWSSIWRGT